MALVGKLETEIEVKSSAEKFFSTYRAKAHIVPKTHHENLHGVEVHEGDLHSSGSIKQWNFNLDGKVHTVKGRIHVDEEKKSVTSVTVEGEILKNYKSVNVTIQVIPKGEGSLVKWIWEYEKVSLDIPDPKKFQDLAINVTKDVDAYATSA